MKPSVYLETTVIGYLTSRLSSSLLIAANQQLTRDWWDDHRDEFRFFISRYVLDECSAGNEGAAAERLDAIQGIPALDVSDEITNLAILLVQDVPLPEKAEVDALHVAVAAVNGVQYLLTVELQTHRKRVTAT